MATYTDNYQLTKPTYAEQADIGVVNSNMNKIDEVMHSSQISLAPAYDQSQTYAEGDKVMYELLMYKCISPTTGVWDGSKWERTTASESGGGGSAELDILGEASGAVASFADGASAELAKCIAEIVPKQAGTGTPSPDNVRTISGYTAVKVDVAGKNLLPTSLATMKSINTAGTWNGNKYTILGVEYTVLSDETGNIIGINANGLSSGNADLSIVSSFTAPENCKMTGCPTGGGANKYQFYLSGNVGDYGSGANISSGATGRPYLRIFNGYNANNLMFYPMIRKATDSEGFEPYKGATYTTPLGQTVYGGQLNVLTGELTIDRVYLKLTSDLFTAFDNTLKAGFTDGDYLGKHIMACNALAPSYSYSTAVDTISVRTQDGRIIAVPSWASECTDLASFKTAYANQTELEVVHTITPQTVQLTPQEVNSLLGQNNISADTGDIDIVYVKASAPIQPNPTGTPTATLKKLGIEGTVFEVEGGGGGSSGGINYSTTEQVIGTWIDGKNIYERTYTGSFTVPSGGTWYNTGIALSDVENLIDTQCRQSIAKWNFISGLNNSGTLVLVNPTSGSLSVENITIQYTKITD